MDGLPKMLGFQAEGAAPIVRGKIVEKPETIATLFELGTLPAGNRPLLPGMNPGA